MDKGHGDDGGSAGSGDLLEEGRRGSGGRCERGGVELLIEGHGFGFIAGGNNLRGGWGRGESG